MRLIDPKKIPKMGEPTTLEDAPMYEFAQCLVDYLVENYGVDVPDIVRCEDCTYWEQAKPDSGSCNRAFEITAYANDFCSYAERKDEVEE